MENILGYLRWRGDITFKYSPFNEIDDLILARFSYIPFEDFLKTEEKISIADAYQRSIDLKIPTKRYFQIEDFKLFELMAKSRRYGKLKIKNCLSILDGKLEKQFGALTVILPKNELYISYRGTDNTMIGWKEDFNMTFLSHIPSQIEALDYLNKSKGIFRKKLRLGGHSKGGNIAIYAAINSNYKLKNKIISISSFDGPGFLDETIDSEKYREMKEKIKTYVPQTSIIGRFLNYNDGYQTVESNQKGILQHDVFTWNLECESFKYLDDIDKGSKQIDAIITEWLNKLSFEDRDKIITIIFQIMETAHITTIDEFDNKIHKVLLKILSSYHKISKEDRKMLDKVAERLLKSIRETMFKKEQKPVKE